MSIRKVSGDDLRNQGITEDGAGKEIVPTGNYWIVPSEKDDKAFIVGGEDYAVAWGLSIYQLLRHEPDRFKESIRGQDQKVVQSMMDLMVLALQRQERYEDLQWVKDNYTSDNQGGSP